MKIKYDKVKEKDMKKLSSILSILLAIVFLGMACYHICIGMNNHDAYHVAMSILYYMFSAHEKNWLEKTLDKE